MTTNDAQNQALVIHIRFYSYMHYYLGIETLSVQSIQKTEVLVVTF